MSRFGLLAGTVAEGVDPTADAWGLNTLGYTLILLPFAVFVIGAIVGIVRRRARTPPPSPTWSGSGMGASPRMLMILSENWTLDLWT